MSQHTGIGQLMCRWLYYIAAILRGAWSILRNLSGDDAYERYLATCRNHHSRHVGEPLDRAAFFRAEQTRKWDGVRRCC